MDEKATITREDVSNRNKRSVENYKRNELATSNDQYMRFESEKNYRTICAIKLELRANACER